ncbi:unnamed protein product [Closterium sp. NIES-53]
MTSLCRSGGSGEGSGGSSGSGGGRTSNLYGAVWWGVSGGGQMQLQWRQRESLPPQKLREWYASRTRGGSSSGSRCSAVQLGASGGGLAQLQRRPRETLTPQQLREWYAQRGASRSSARCPYVIRTGDRAELLRQGVDIFALDCDAILTAMYALTIGTEGDCYLCLLPDLGIEAAALSAPVSVRLADPSGCPVVACSSTVLPCPTVPSGSLSCLHLPSFSTNLVSTAALQDAMVTTTTPGGRRVSICTCTRTGRHLATFTHWPGSSLYTLATEPPQVAASAQVSASGQVAPPRSCRLLSHQTLLWHHRLGHPSLPHLRGMHSRLLVSGLPRSLPPLLPSPAPPCLPCVEGRQRATPHSSFPPTTAPLQTLHMDVWGPARDLPVLRLHSEKGGEFSSNLLRDFCRWEGILQSFTLPDSPQQNGIAERRIGLFMEVAPRTSMIHAAAPHFLWPFVVRYAAHHLNLWPRVSLPETSPTFRWTGEVGDASVFRVWGSRAFVRDTSADKLSARAIPCVFLGFVLDAPGWHFYHPTSRRVFPSQDVTFDELVPFYRLFLYHSTPPPPPPLFLAPGPPPVDPLLPQGPAPSGVSQVDPLPGTVPVECTRLRSGAAGAGDCAVGDTRAGGLGASRLGGAGVTAGAGGTGGAAAAGPGGAGTRGTGAAGIGIVGSARAGGSGAGDLAESGGTGAGGLELEELELETLELLALELEALALVALELEELELLTLELEVLELGVMCLAVLVLEVLCSHDRTSFLCFSRFLVSRLLLSLLLPSCGHRLTSHSSSYSQPPHCLLLLLTVSRPEALQSVVSLSLILPRLFVFFAPVVAFLVRVLLLSPAPTLWHFSDLARAASPTVSCLLATVVNDPSFDSTAASALVAELVDFAATCRLDYATALVAESTSPSPPSVGGECAHGTDVLEDRQEDFECLAIAIAMDAEMASWKSTGTYVDAVPPSRANIVDGMWIFRVKRPPNSPPAFKARYVARGFSQRQGVDYFHAFSPTPKMTTLRVLLHVAAQLDYELHSLDFSTAFLQDSLHEEIWLRHPLGLTGLFPTDTYLSLPPLSKKGPFCCRAAEQPSRRAARQLSRPTAKPPSSRAARAAEPPCSTAATAPADAPRPYLLGLGRAVDFEVWVDDLQLFLQCDRADGLSLLDLTSGASPAPPATADSTVRSQWATRDAAARLAVRRHLPTTERAHFSQYKSAQTLYDAVVARYSSPATTALSRLILPYLFPDLAAFPTVADLITHLRTSDTRYGAALLAEDHFLSVCPTTLTVDLLEQRLLAAETSIVAVGASRGDPRTPVFEGCSPSPLLPSVASAAMDDLGGFESVGAASAPSGRRSPGRGKGGKGNGGTGGGGGGGGGGSGGGWGGGGRGGGGGGVGSSSGGGGGDSGGGGSGGGGGGGVGGGGGGGGGSGGSGGAGRGSTQRSGSGGGTGPCTYVLRTGDRASEQCGGLHSTQRCFGHLTDAWRHQFPDATEIPRWGNLSRAGVAIIDLDYDAILAVMYAVSTSDEGDCYLCLPPDPGGEAAALGACEAAAPGAGESALSGTVSAQVFHTFTLDSGASRSFFRDRTTLTPLSRPVAVSLADPFGGPVLASLQRPGLVLSMASRVLVSGLPRSLPPLPPGPAPSCVPCVEGRQCAAPHSSEFPPTEAPLQTLHVDVWGPARVRGQGHERYFLLVVDDYSRYTTVFPLRSKGDVAEVLIDWIHAARLQLREHFGSDFPVLRLHSDRGGEFSSARLGAFCRAHGIRQTFTLPASPQQNGIAERRIGMVMDVARTSMIHTAAPHFLWPFAVQYAAHQLNLQPRVSVPETSPTLRWTGKVGDASAFRVWGSRAFVRDLSADKLSPRAVPCVFLGFPPDAPGWQFYHPTSRRVLSSQDVTFDKSVPFYRLFPYRTAPLPPPPLFLAPVLGGRRPVVLIGHADASWADDQATQRSSQGYTFSLGSGSVSWRSTRSSSVLSSSCEAEIFAGAMAAQELRWLTYLLADLGEPPRSPPVLYVDNKAMLALCREHRLEHRTKHIALRYFLARELQQRGQLRLAYVASEPNTADIFTKALAPSDHQRLCTLLACFALLDWSCDLLFSPTLPMGMSKNTNASAAATATAAVPLTPS